MVTRLWGSVALACAVLFVVSGCVPEPAQQPPAQSAEPTASLPADSDPTSPGLQAVIVIAGVDLDGKHVTATSYVAGVIEEGGACEYVFENAKGARIVETAVSVPDRSTTACPAAVVPIEKFSHGTWSAVLVYEALSGDVATSIPAELEIP